MSNLVNINDLSNVKQFDELSIAGVGGAVNSVDLLKETAIDPTCTTQAMNNI